jgi:serine/threonine protein kinase/tetratricopeptide (TPR) repeat protein
LAHLWLNNDEPTMSTQPESNREKDLFSAALELSTADRESFLQRECAGDDDLRRRVEELLAAHDGADALFPTDPDELTEIVPLSEGPGTQIGRYKLLEQIGEGGMGVVYMAEQHEPFHKRVALKIIKLGMDTKAVVARFEAERQALALMNHPNIAKVLDAGATDTGRPYFVMELVRGMPITEYCDQQKLSTRQRLELFIPVCQAIQHAHQKGIIHRDIKPSNVLVALFDDKPVPMVIDFGIAKATHQRLTEKTLFTRHGQFIGTLEYIAPEQARGSQIDIDTRADVYSLGVLLYQLLTGSTPFPHLREQAWEESMRIIREEDPPRPSTRLSTLTAVQLGGITDTHGGEPPHKISLVLRRELDWIVMACLEKDRSRRYDTANGLALDIARYLRGDAPEKAPPGVWYQFSKLARKHKKTFAMAAVIAVILAGATVFSTWQAVVANRAKEAAQKAEEATAREATRLAAINGWMNRDLLSQGDAGTGEDRGQRRSIDIKLMDALLQSAQHLTEDFKGHPEIEGEIRLTIGRALGVMEGYEAAIENLRRAYELLAASVGPNHTNTLHAKFQLGAHMNWLTINNNDEEALKLMQEAYDAYVAEYGDESPSALRMGEELGTSYGNKQRVDESDQILTRLATLVDPLDPASTKVPYHIQLLLTSRLAILRRFQGRDAEALRIYERLMPALEAYQATNSSLTDMTSVEYYGLTQQLWNPQEPAVAERAYLLALKLSRAAVQESFPTSQILTRLGWLYEQQRDYTNALYHHRQALAAAWGREPFDEQRNLNNVLKVTAGFGDWVGTAGELRRLREELPIHDGTWLAREILLQQLAGNSDRSQTLQTQFFESARTNATMHFSAEIDALRALLALPLPSGREDVMALLIERSVQKQGRELWFDRERCLDVSQGMFAFRRGDDARAISLLEPAVEALGDNILALPPRYVLAMAHRRQGKSEEAEALYDRANAHLDRLLETGMLTGVWGPGRWDVVAQGEALRSEAGRELVRPEKHRPIKDVLAEKRKPYEELQYLDRKATLEARRRDFTAARDLYARLSDRPVFQAALAQNRDGISERLASVYWVLGDQAAHFEVLQAMPDGTGNPVTVLLALAAISEPLQKDLESRRREGPDRQRLERNWADRKKGTSTPFWGEQELKLREQLVLGMCLYREGQYGPSLELLEPLTASSRFHTPVMAKAFSAMAHARLGDAEKARRLLKEADALYFQTVIEPGRGQHGPWFDYDIMMEMVIREADQLIEPDVDNAPHVAALPPEGW